MYLRENTFAMGLDGVRMLIRHRCCL